MEKLNLFVLRHRRWLVAFCVGLAAWATVSALSHEPDYVQVPVAARDLSSGSALKDTDIAYVAFNRASAPSKILSRSDIRSRIVAGPMRQGEPFTDFRVITPHRLDSGEQLALIEVSGSSARLLRVGDRVDVMALDPDDSSQTRVIAHAAKVTTVDIDTQSHTAALGVAVTASAAHEIMSAQLQSPLVVLPTKSD